MCLSKPIQSQTAAESAYESLTPVPKTDIAGAQITLSKTVFTYNGKVQKPSINRIKSLALKEGTDYTAAWSDTSSKNAGTYTVTVTGKGSYEGTAKASYRINKASNTLKVKGKTATVKSETLKKKTVKLKVIKVIKFVKKGQGKKTYKKLRGSKRIIINKKTGNIAVKKGLKKGIYKVKVKVKASGNSNYKASSVKIVTFKLKVK